MEFYKFLNNTQAWDQRADAIKAVLYAFPLLAKTIGIEIDASRPLVAGHDYGAYTAQLVLGVTVSTASGTMNFTDDRFFAGLLLSPQGVGIMEIGRASCRERGCQYV